jgi:general secretion pathway protein K
MPFGARSAAGTMSALSLTLKVRGDRRSGAIHHLRRDVNRGRHWRFERLSLPTFFAAAKKVGAAPHRGNASRPPRKQEKAKALRAQQKNSIALLRK